jgi:hypothetical protein
MQSIEHQICALVSKQFVLGTGFVFKFAQYHDDRGDIEMSGDHNMNQKFTGIHERIIKLGLESGMLNYVEHETPRHYFLCGHADEECLEKFAQLIVRECVRYFNEDYERDFDTLWREDLSKGIKEHFGVEE